MRSPGKIATLVICIAVTGAAIIAWQVHRHKENERKLAEAAQAWRMRAERGDATAQAELGYLYFHGRGLPRDYDQAASWDRKSADQGNAKGEAALGYLYYYGDGVPQDFAEAVGWYRKAADQNDAWAQTGLGDAYYYGNGVPQDYAQAALWYRKAADQNYARAQYDLGYMYKYGIGVAQERAEANQWYHKAAARGDERAQVALGLRGERLNSWGMISLLILFLAGGLVCAGSLSPRAPHQGWRRALICAGGALPILYVILKISGIYFLVLPDSRYSVFLFRLVLNLVLGLSTPFLISIIWQRCAKTLVALSSILFVGVNLLFIGFYSFSVARNPLLRSTFPFGSEGIFIGAGVSAALLLWLERRENGNRLAASESSAGNGLG